jgi:hypothetical protein
MRAFQHSLILFIIEVIKILFRSTQTDTQFYRLRQNGIFFKTFVYDIKETLFQCVQTSFEIFSIN